MHIDVLMFTVMNKATWKKVDTPGWNQKAQTFERLGTNIDGRLMQTRKFWWVNWRDDWALYHEDMCPKNDRQKESQLCESSVFPEQSRTGRWEVIYYRCHTKIKWPLVSQQKSNIKKTKTNPNPPQKKLNYHTIYLNKGCLCRVNISFFYSSLCKCNGKWESLCYTLSKSLTGCKRTFFRFYMFML